MSNPYAAPVSDFSLSGAAGDTYVPHMFSLRGRIGRIRWVAYSTGLSILAALVLTLLAGFSASFMGQAMAIMVSYVSPLATLVAVLLMSIRRLRDLDRHPAWAMLLVVPFINLLFGLWLLFGPGTPGPNRYGPAPSRNGVVTIILALLIPVIFMLVVVAVAIPAYQMYVAKSRQAQQQQGVAPAVAPESVSNPTPAQPSAR